MQQIDILTIMFFYCQKSIISPELQERLYSLDIAAILRYTDAIPEQGWWRKLSVFLNFTVWLKEQVSEID